MLSDVEWFFMVIWVPTLGMKPPEHFVFGGFLAVLRSTVGVLIHGHLVPHPPKRQAKTPGFTAEKRQLAGHNPFERASIKDPTRQPA